jgi:hypothetical protein
MREAANVSGFSLSWFSCSLIVETEKLIRKIEAKICKRTAAIASKSIFYQFKIIKLHCGKSLLFQALLTKLKYVDGLRSKLRILNR